MRTFDYHRPASLTEVSAALKATPDARLLAGGMTLIPALKLRLATPQALVDLSAIADLRGIRVGGGVVTVGAMTRHAELERSAEVRAVIPALTDLAGSIGDPQVRNRGTLGGSLAHADPAADYPAVMLALDAEVHVKGSGGWRLVKAQDFFQGMFTVDLAANEIIAGVQFKPVKSAAYAKLHQRASHFAIVGVAAALDVSKGVIQSARVGLTGASSHATRLTEVEQALTGKAPSAENIEAAARVAGQSVTDVNSDLHASEAYRRAMIPVFTKRALMAAMARTG